MKSYLAADPLCEMGQKKKASEADLHFERAGWGKLLRGVGERLLRAEQGHLPPMEGTFSCAQEHFPAPSTVPLVGAICCSYLLYPNVPSAQHTALPHSAPNKILKQLSTTALPLQITDQSQREML